MLTCGFTKRALPTVNLRRETVCSNLFRGWWWGGGTKGMVKKGEVKKGMVKKGEGMREAKQWSEGENEEEA
jgi:hypothetical protein